MTPTEAGMWLTREYPNETSSHKAILNLKQDLEEKLKEELDSSERKKVEILIEGCDHLLQPI